MDRSGLVTLCTYNRYANRLVLDTAQKMDAGLMSRPSSPSHTSVHDLLRHMLSCERSFLIFSQGTEWQELPEFPAFGDMRRYWEALGDETLTYLQNVPAPRLETLVRLPFELQGKTPELAVWQLLTQAFMHSAHHRGELSIVMTGLGYPLPTLDIILQFCQAA